jgi:hypothetical protein
VEPIEDGEDTVAVNKVIAVFGETLSMAAVLLVLVPGVSSMQCKPLSFKSGVLTGLYLRH